LDHYAKKHIQIAFKREGDGKTDEKINKHFYYACVYDQLNKQNNIRGRNTKINLIFKEKNVPINIKYSPLKEGIGLHRLLQMTKKLVYEAITQIRRK
jgi:hypothetical protein